MSLTTDRDLLIYEPNLFRDVAFAGQQRIEIADARIVGFTLTSETADFEAAGVGPGSVTLVESIALEVIERVGPGELTVSRIRPDRNGPPVKPRDVTGVSLTSSTFDHQIQVALRQISLMVAPDGTPPSLATLEEITINVDDLVRLGAVGALNLVFAAASALATENSILWNKAMLYRSRFAAMRHQFVARLDLDGDGEVDMERSLDVVRLIRR